MSDASHVARLVSDIGRHLGPIDVLVANAGVGERADAFQADLELWDRTMRINATGAFLVAQRVIPSMRDRGFGRMVFMSSIAARVGGVISPAYAASKAAVEGLMHYYAAHLVRFGITANAISPAFFRTDMMAGAAIPTPEQMPMGRLGEPHEVGPVLEMIVRSPYLTGQTIQLNAGRLPT